MAIELRTNKASALTYNEMDRNFSSFFYSASVDTDTNRLYLWYTGSANLNMSPGDNFGPARSVEIELQPTTGNNPTLVVAGNPRNIQFRHAIDPRLDADTGFIYTTSQQLGIGAATPNATTKIHAVGTGIIPATLRLETTSTGNANRRAVVDFYQGATFMGTMGRDNHNDNNLYIKTHLGRIGDGFTRPVPPGKLIINIGSNTTSGAWTNVGLGINTLTPLHALHVQGNGYITGKLAVGDVPGTSALNVFQTAQTGTSLGDFEIIAKFGITPQQDVDSLKILSVRGLAGGDSWTTNGMRIQQKVNLTYKGYIQFSGAGNQNGFSIGTGESTSPHKPGDVGIAERLRIDEYGNVTINKPVANAKFDVNGDTIVTGSFTVTQNATVQGNIVGQGTATVNLSLTTGTSAAVGTDLIVGNTTTILNVPASVESTPRILTVSQTSGQVGQVQYINSIVPKGGIMMWAGSVGNIPTGWSLCNGVGEWSPGNPIPDLRERFIVGAGGYNTEITTYQYDRVGSTVNDFTFVYYGSPVMIYTKKINTNGISDNYDETYPNDPTNITNNGDPVGFYHMYATGGNYFYYINYDGTIRKGNTRDYDGNVAAPANLNTLFPKPAVWSDDVYWAPINQYTQAYGWYHVYQKKFNLNQTTATGTSLWYWIFDKRTQNYSLVRGTFNGDNSVGTNVGNVWYKTGPSVGYSYTPFQKHVQAGAATTDTNGQPTKNNARRIQMQGVQYPGGTYSVGDTGGFNEVQLTKATTPSHAHIGDRWSGGYGTGGNGALGQGTGYRNNTRVTSPVGGDQPHENRPPYYALAFIIYTGA